MAFDTTSWFLTQQILKSLLEVPSSFKRQERLEEALRQLPSSNRYAAELLKQLESGEVLRRSPPRTQLIRKLREAYQDERLVLVLGAGTSMVHGLPDWLTLLQRLLIGSIAQEKGEPEERARVLANTFTAVFSPNPLIAARYLQEHYRRDGSNPLAFEEAIRAAVYEDLDLENRSPLLSEVRQLCIAPGQSPTIDCVITYNYDDLLEFYLEDLGVEIPYRPIHAAGMVAGPRELPIFHVHGYLPREGKLDERNRVALADLAYHQQYTDVYRWSNLTQINKFAAHPCVFIGVSFTDPNLRRLLDIAREQRGGAAASPHFAFRKRYDPDQLSKALEKALQESPDLLDETVRASLKLEEVVRHLADLMERFEENDLKSFGVNTIWVDDHDEVPQVLKQVRRS